MAHQQDKTLWEILVPANSNDGLEFNLDYHKQWDEQVRNISGGLTILKSAKGQWLDPDGELFFDKMIPVRIYCSEPDIDAIIGLTMKHYSQKAVLAYQVSSYVKLVHDKDIK